jgi:hypothetical protein
MIRAVLVGALAMIVLGAGIVAALAYLPSLAPQRRVAIEQLLRAVIDRPVTISREVLLLPGKVTTLELGGIAVGKDSAGGRLEHLTIDDATVGFRLLPLLRGDFQIEQLSASGLALTLAPPSDAGEEALPISASLIAFSRLLDSSGTRDLELRDLGIVSGDDPDGWGRDYKLDELSSKAGDDAGDRVIGAKGTINGKAIEIDATFAAPAGSDSGKAGRTFSTTTTLPGYESTMAGTLDADGGALDATFTVAVSSLADMLEVFRLQREFDGTAKLAMRLVGPAEAVAAEAIKAEGRLSTGEKLSIDGRIANFSTASGVDLTFAADLRTSHGEGARPSSAFDIALEKIDGRAKGDVAALTLADLTLTTNLTAADIAAIGPVSVDRVTRDANGHLAFRGIHIVSGDSQAPSLDLKGDMLDVLNRQGISLAGSFDLDALELATGKPAPPAIGRLAGELAIADSSGALRLERLTGKLTGKGALQLAIDMPKPADGRTSAPVGVKLEVADLAALAQALGADTASGDGASTGGLSFDGRVAVDDALEVDGQVAIGRSPVTVELSQDVTDGKAVFRGKLDSPALRLDDLRRLVVLQDIGRQLGDGAAAPSAADPAAPPSWLDAELDIAATVLAEQSREPIKLAAHLVYGDGKAALDPMELGYAGGTFRASARIGLGATPPPVSLDGTAQALQVADLLSEVGATPLVDAPLGAELDLDASGVGAADLASTVSGTFGLTLGAGTVGTSLIDLAGESIVRWLFSDHHHAELVCGEASLTLKAGQGTVDRLVLETTNVQLLGRGSLDLPGNTIDIAFLPRPMHKRLVELVTPFKVEGALTAPKIDVGSRAKLAGRAVGEALALPLDAVGALVDIGARTRQPCSTTP